MKRKAHKKTMKYLDVSCEVYLMALAQGNIAAQPDAPEAHRLPALLVGRDTKSRKYMC